MTKDISNYTVNGVKTDGVTTSTVTLNVANGDVITVKSGTSIASYTVTGCLPADAPHGGGDPITVATRTTQPTATTTRTTRTDS